MIPDAHDNNAKEISFQIRIHSGVLHSRCGLHTGRVPSLSELSPFPSDYSEFACTYTLFNVLHWLRNDIYITNGVLFYTYSTVLACINGDEWQQTISVQSTGFLVSATISFHFKNWYDFIRLIDYDDIWMSLPLIGLFILASNRNVSDKNSTPWSNVWPYGHNTVWWLLARSGHFLAVS